MGQCKFKLNSDFFIQIKWCKHFSFKETKKFRQRALKWISRANAISRVAAEASFKKASRWSSVQVERYLDLVLLGKCCLTEAKQGRQGSVHIFWCWDIFSHRSSKNVQLKLCLHLNVRLQQKKKNYPPGQMHSFGKLTQCLMTVYNCWEMWSSGHKTESDWN